jgi:hypothetical protein
MERPPKPVAQTILILTVSKYFNILTIPFAIIQIIHKIVLEEVNNAGR